MKEFDELVSVMHQLRQKCPWDQEQSLESLRTYLIEEAFEVLDAMNEAIELKDYNNLIEELGDLLLQILFQSEIISEKSDHKPAIKTVIKELNDKLIRRHPHVFGEASADSATEVLRQWDEIKKTEKTKSNQSPLDDVASALTSLQRATKFGKHSKKLHFDWSDSKEVWEQLQLELQELQAAESYKDKEEELGDVLFCLAQWARHEKIEPEIALANSNAKFKKRFEYVLKKADLKNLSRNEKEALWNESKKFFREEN
ncbi:MAG: nucleoside triphosphate pyrophosphohydrolase [Bdellovibrionota bacterium]